MHAHSLHPLLGCDDAICDTVLAQEDRNVVAGLLVGLMGWLWARLCR